MLSKGEFGLERFDLLKEFSVLGLVLYYIFRAIDSRSFLLLRMASVCWGEVRQVYHRHARCSSMLIGRAFLALFAWCVFLVLSYFLVALLFFFKRRSGEKKPQET